MAADGERLLGAGHPDTLSYRSNLAAAYHEQGDLQRAIRLHERVLADRQRVLGDDHPQTLASARNLAQDLEQLGDHHAAAALRAQIRHRRRGQGEAAQANGP